MWFRYLGYFKWKNGYRVKNEINSRKKYAFIKRFIEVIILEWSNYFLIKKLLFFLSKFFILI